MNTPPRFSIRSSLVAAGCCVALALMSLSSLQAAEGEVSVGGITEPFLDVILSTPVAGLITTQNFQAGENVNQGEIILELDKRIEELEVTRRELVVELRKTDRDSTRILFDSTKSVAKEELMKKEVDYKVAEAELSIAQEQLARRQTPAPFSGTITELFLDLGEACQPYQPLIRLVDTTQCYFVSNIEAKTAAPLKPNQQVVIEIDTGDNQVKLPGKIIFLSPVVDPASGLLKVKVLFDNTDGKIRPGLSGRMIF